MSWQDKVKGINVGDRVALSRSYVQSTCQYTGDTPFARGTVTAINDLGETKLATVDWGNPDIPPTVNMANLSKVTEKGIQERY